MAEFMLMVVIFVTIILPLAILAWDQRDNLVEISDRIRDRIKAVRASRKPQKDGQAELRSYYSERHHAREIARTQWELDFANANVEAFEWILQQHDARVKKWELEKTSPKQLTFTKRAI